jgi:glycerophosphoryl diester phosphodiesterase
VRKLDAGSWKHKKFVGERVPTLDEILAAHKGSGCTAVVEIKTTGISDEVIHAVRRARMTGQTAVIAFNEKVVREMKTLAPELPVAWLASKHLDGTPAKRADWIARKAREYKTNMVDLNYGMLSREVIAELKRRNIVVWAWTVNDPLVMEALMRWGVDSITTDRPDVAARLMKDGKPSKRKTAAHRRRLHRNR